jgi:hypothetical protein
VSFVGLLVCFNLLNVVVVSLTEAVMAGNGKGYYILTNAKQDLKKSSEGTMGTPAINI